jgi:Prohead core protein serine protease
MTATVAAVIDGTFLRPGVSKNNRLYTKEAIGKAVRRMQEEIKNPSGLPVSMATSHGAAYADDALSTIAKVTKVWQDNDGSAKFVAEVLNTSKGKDIAIASAAGGIKGISIRGGWMSKPYTDESTGADTADDMFVKGFDFTGSPGVEGAQIENTVFLESWDPNNPTSLTFSESVEDVNVVENFTEEVTDAHDATIREAIEEVLAILEDGKAPYGDVTYADPGYKADKKKRYPINTAGHVRAAWSYINMPKNHTGYTASQVASIKAKIKRAAKKFGINIAEQDALTKDLADMLVEAYVSMSIDNGAGTVSASGYTDDGGKLVAVATRIAATVIGALNTLDPDADGDIDLAGGDSSSSKESVEAASSCLMCSGTLPDDANYCPGCGVPTPTDSSDDETFTQTNKEGVDMTAENKTAEELAAEKAAVETAPVATGLSAEDVAKIVAEAIAKDRTEQEEAAAAAKAELEEAEKAAAEAAAAELREKQIYTAEDLAEAARVAAQETAAQLKESAIAEARQDPTRKGLASDNTATAGAEDAFDPRELAKMDKDQFRKAQIEAWSGAPAWSETHMPHRDSFFTALDRAAQ